MNYELHVLRLVHILGGIFWVGSALFSMFFLAPAMAAAGPAGGQVMGALRKRGLMTALPIVALLTIASGARLLMLASRSQWAEYVARPQGMTFVLAGAAATIAFLLSLLVAKPAGDRMVRLAAQLPSATGEQRSTIEREMATLMQRGKVASVMATVLLVFAAGGMAVARYLP